MGNFYIDKCLSIGGPICSIREIVLLFAIGIEIQVKFDTQKKTHTHTQGSFKYLTFWGLIKIQLTNQFLFLLTRL